jgi:hypothetical protein
MSWFSLFTEKQKLKHENALLRETVSNNMIAEMDYKLKRYAYNKEVLKKNVVPLVIGVVLVLIIYQCL